MTEYYVCVCGPREDVNFPASPRVASRVILRAINEYDGDKARFHPSAISQEDRASRKKNGIWTSCGLPSVSAFCFLLPASCFLPPAPSAWKYPYRS